MGEVAKKKRPKQPKASKSLRSNKPPAPDHLTMRLFDPGMSLLHRAGLGGLACTLKAMERQVESEVMTSDCLPAPFTQGNPPWKIREQSIELRFGSPDNAAEYLRKLFAFAFQIRDGLLFLPGQYPDPPPALAVRAELQNALSRTFLQGAKKNVGLDPVVPYFVDPDGSGIGQIQIDFQKCEWYLHQKLWKAFVDVDSSELLAVPLKKIDGTKNVNIGSLYPGAIKRHDSHSESDVTETLEGLLCALFFLVGCFAAKPSNSGDGVLLIPEVQSLAEFVVDRPFMTPRTVSEVRVAGLADAAFQAEVRLRSRCFLMGTAIPSCRASRFSLRTWTKPQKSRVDSVEVRTEQVARVEPESPSAAEHSFARFERAMAVLPSGVRPRKDESAFWNDSVIRPFIAENLAAGRDWYQRFVRIADTKEKRRKLAFEQKGLSAMISDKTMFDIEEEHVVIRSVHRAMQNLRGKISDTYMDRPELILKKFDDEREKWGRTFAGNTTLEQFRKSLTEMFRRAGANRELQDNWPKLLPMLRRNTWEHARDLVLIGLCSYKGQRKPVGSDEN